MPIYNLTGKLIGGYVLHDELGHGGMAVVYRAIQPAVNREVALKVVPIGKTTQSRTYFERFAREAEVVASLEHIHILPIYEYGVDEDFAYIAMRYLRGGSLRDLIADRPLPLENVASLFSQIARGLGYAHRRGVIHRDVKPSNILLDEMGNAYLSDFGLAKYLGQTSSWTRSGSVIGTLAYISPEQVLESPVDHRSDIYSLGIVLYDMLTGKPPFESSSNNPATLLHKHLSVIPMPPSFSNPAVPKEVDAVVMKALEKDPDKRYQSADDMAHALNRSVGRSSTPSYITPDYTIQWPRGLRESTILPIMTVVLLILVVAASLWFMIQANQTAIPTPKVIAGQRGSPEDVAPNSAEISLAQNRLGPTGFISYVTCNQTSEYHATQAREISQMAQDEGLRLRVYDSDSDAYKQITQLEKARTDGARAFIICLLDAAATDNALTSLEETHPPIAFFNPGDKLYGGMGLLQDEKQVGLAAGRFAGQIIRDELGGSARVVILDYPDLPNLVQRADGLEAGVKELAPTALILGRYLGGTVENGKKSVEGLIERGVRFDVIVSINDAGALGAIEAMDGASFDPSKIFISSIDAEALAQQYIRQGHYIRGSLTVDRQTFSRAAVNAIIKMLAGMPVPETILVKPGVMLTRQNLP